MDDIKADVDMDASPGEYEMPSYRRWLNGYPKRTDAEVEELKKSAQFINDIMKSDKKISDRRCGNCLKYEECQDEGVFDDDPGFDFCSNYEDVGYPNDDNNEKY